jgi:DNA topoisomerase-3
LGKALVITEKPSVARDITDVLGGFTEHEGYFESDTHIVTFAVGHLYELLSPEEVDEKYKRWTLDALPILPDEFQLKPKKGQSDRIRTIRKLLQRDDTTSVVNACDAGREGELIFREIVDTLNTGKPVHRLWLQSMTSTAIRDGFGRLRPSSEFDGLAASAACRAQSDWMIGMNATRALTKRLKSRKEKTAWSAGRVQTPTLAMLVDQEFKILAHVPRPYWQVLASFDHDGNSYRGTWFDPNFKAGEDAELKDERIFDESRAAAIVAAVDGQPAIAEETRKPSKETAPPLFNLTSLQREGNRRFGWSARRTLSAAQRCYERHKILTYPRTDSRCLPNDYRGIVDETIGSFANGAGQGGAEFSEYAAAAAQLKKAGLVNTERTFDDSKVSDHFAVIPTGTLPAAPLTGDDKRLFDLVVRRFLGNFFPPAVWERVERVTEVQGEKFRTRARSLKETGWRTVLPPATEEPETEVLQPLVRGESAASGVSVRTVSTESESDETRPPARITEARLLSLMENAGKLVEDENHAAAIDEKGIGTPATRADVIENLIAKGYVVRVAKALRPSVKGIRLIDTLHRIDIVRLTSPELTGEIEHHLLEVERGSRKASDFMAEITNYACEIVETAKTFEYEDLYDTKTPLGSCPSCGKPVFEMAWFYRCTEEPGVEREDDCPMRFWKDTSGRYLNRDAVSALLRDGKTGTLDGFTARNGRTYKGFIEVDREEWKLVVKSLGYNEGEGVSELVEYDVNPDPLGPCPFGEGCSVVESPTHFLCERQFKIDQLKNEKSEKGEDGKTEGAQDGDSEELPKGCGFVFPRTVCKREITRDEAEVYLANRKTDLLEDFTSRFGRPFSAMLTLKENGRHGFEFLPRKPRGGKADVEQASGAKRKKATKKKTKKKKTTKKKATKKKATKKKTSKKAATKKKTGTKAATKKKVSKKAATKKSATKKKTVAEPPS